jgi:leucyl/phenylalanyl-tRNA--protein transferase
MRGVPREFTRLTAELLVRAYSAGIFPMAETGEAATVFWLDPPVRGILPLDAFHVPRRLAKTVRRQVFDVRCDTAFGRVMRCCAEATRQRTDTWINGEIIRAYTELHERGCAHSVESWRGEELVGGIYGVSLGGAFFGESMFWRQTDASKVALVHLVARLKLAGYRLLDIQFVTDHLRRFGAVDIPRGVYLQRLADALSAATAFPAAPAAEGFDEALAGVLRGKPRAQSTTASD